MKQARVHGGALGAAMARYGGERGDWLDLSTGIAPCSPPLPVPGLQAFTRLPEREAEEALREAARRFYGAGPQASIVLAPGTQSLISLVPHLVFPGRAAVVSPTYGEHERALIEAGHEARRIACPADLPNDARLLVVVNPNNPDARRFARADLLDLAADLSRRGGLLVVDEAFMDADPAESLGLDAGRDGLLVLRSFGKFFGLAGLRLGFALTHAALAGRIERRLGPWPVSGPALSIATALMGDEAMIHHQRAGIAAQAERLSRVLRVAGLTIEGATSLFALVRHSQAGALFEALARRRILTRPFAERADWLRFGNPLGDEEATRLAEALHEALADIGR